MNRSDSKHPLFLKEIIATEEVRKKTNETCKAIDDTAQTPIASKNDWFPNAGDKIHSIVLLRKKMEAIAVDSRKIAGEAKQLRWENAKLMLDKLWEYLGEKSAGAVI